MSKELKEVREQSQRHLGKNIPVQENSQVKCFSLFDKWQGDGRDWRRVGECERSRGWTLRSEDRSPEVLLVSTSEKPGAHPSPRNLVTVQILTLRWEFGPAIYITNKLPVDVNIVVLFE